MASFRALFFSDKRALLYFLFFLKIFSLELYSLPKEQNIFAVVVKLVPACKLLQAFRGKASSCLTERRKSRIYRKGRSCSQYNFVSWRMGGGVGGLRQFWRQQKSAAFFSYILAPNLGTGKTQIISTQEIQSHLTFWSTLFTVFLMYFIWNCKCESHDLQQWLRAHSCGSNPDSQRFKACGRR